MGEQEQREMDRLAAALRGFRGTIVSGGTKSGIAAVPGLLQERVAPDQLKSIGYLPQGAGQLADDRYFELIRSPNDDFSILDPLRFWEHFLASGGNPQDVRMIAYNGGRISAIEFRLALALGARVGVIRGSGREADRLLGDGLWAHCQSTGAEGGAPRLVPLDFGVELDRFIKEG
jgi:hypothetical protein